MVQVKFVGSGVPNQHLKETESKMIISGPLDEKSKGSELWRVSDSWVEKFGFVMVSKGRGRWIKHLGQSG